MEKTRATSWFIRIAIAVVVLGGLVWYLRRGHAAAPDHTSGGGSGEHRGSGAGGGRVVPVQVATADRKDYAVWLDGIGTVAAFQQVTVHTLVDGRLDSVKFVEGQAVK